MDRTFIPNSCPNLQRMHALALKKIFSTLTAYEMAELDRGIDEWVHKPNLDNHSRIELTRIVNALLVDEDKIEPEYTINFGKAKFFIKKFGLNYRAYFRAGLPYIKIDPNYGKAENARELSSGIITIGAN